MALDPYLTEIALFSFNFAPRGWALCNGQILPINQNQAMFALIGTTYGGNGQTTFALPNLQGRVPLGCEPGLAPNYPIGQTGGQESVTLTTNQIPAHTHPLTPANVTATLRCRNTDGNQATPAAGVPAVETSGVRMYSSSAPNASMHAGTLTGGTLTATGAGSGQGHENRQPYLALTYCIALQGIFPSQG